MTFSAEKSIIGQLLYPFIFLNNGYCTSDESKCRSVVNIAYIAYNHMFSGDTSVRFYTSEVSPLMW